VASATDMLVQDYVIPGVMCKYDTGMAMVTFGKLVAAVGAFSALAAHTAQSCMGKAVWCPGPTLLLKVSGVPGPPPATHMQLFKNRIALTNPLSTAVVQTATPSKSQNFICFW
jgi:hypothetical protein